MLKRFVRAGAFVLLLGGPAPVAPPSGSSPIIQSRVADPCNDNCVLACFWLTGNWGACQFDCMDEVCHADPVPVATKIYATRRDDLPE